AVHAARRGEHQALDALALTLVDHDLGRAKIDRDRFFGIDIAGSVTDQGGEGDDALAAADAVANVVYIADVAVQQFEIRIVANLRQSLIAVKEAVQHTHPVSPTQQLPAYVRTHVAGTAGYQDRVCSPHVVPPVPPGTRVHQEIECRISR